MSARRALPTGTPTFLFTDIEGSTRLLDALGDRWAGVRDRHQQLLRAAWAAHGGVEMGTEGDSFFVAFDRPSDAVAAARAAQLALASEPWEPGHEVRVRMGMHTGEAQVVADDYVGMAVHLAARVAAAGHGGQVLLTGVTGGLVPDLAVVDLGDHRLKDIRESVRLLQLLDPHLPVDFPPLRTLSTAPNNLPASLDEFVGRDAELAGVTDALAEARLVTLTGAGGSGKTRLAIEAAARAVPDHARGAWLVELGSVSDTTQVPSLLAQVLGIREQRGQSLLDALVAGIGDGDVLVVLDNCEHLVDAVAELASRLLTACPALRVLATSRERLGVRGERVLPVPPLDLPDLPALAAESDAVRLFLARARAVAPGFDLESAALPVVIDICRRLDGLPLAIELAAARLRSISVDQLHARLDDRFRILTARDRTGAARQRTLETVVAWSYDLLDEDERAFFRRLSVFRGTFGLDAAEQVVGRALDVDVIDLIDALVDKSLVTPVGTPTGALRYSMLETLRSYGRRRLAEAGEADEAHAALLDWALREAAVLEVAMRTERQDSALAAVRPEQANLRGAIEWALERGDDEAALRVVSLAPVGPGTERVALIDELLGRLTNAPARVVGFALVAAANSAMEAGHWSGTLDYARRATVAFEDAGEPVQAAWGRYFQLYGMWGTGQLDEMEAICRRCLADFRAHGSALGVAYASWTLSQHVADAAEAARLADDACRLFREMGAMFGLAHALEGRGLVALRSDDCDIAPPLLIEALEIFTDGSAAGCAAHVIEAAAACLARGGELVAVAELAAAAECLRTSAGHVHRPWELQGYHELLEALEGADAGALTAARARGASHTLDSAAARATAALRAAATARSGRSSG